MRRPRPAVHRGDPAVGNTTRTAVTSGARCAATTGAGARRATRTGFSASATAPRPSGRRAPGPSGRHTARTSGRHTARTSGRHTARTSGRHTARTSGASATRAWVAISAAAGILAIRPTARGHPSNRKNVGDPSEASQMVSPGEVNLRTVSTPCAPRRRWTSRDCFATLLKRW
jgi:hypothetical protein